MGTYEQEDLRFAHDLADAADAVSLRHFWRGRNAVRRKPDGTLVSAADVAVEAAVLERLATERPGDAVLSEECGGRGAGRRVWVIDPIDGTEAFVAGQRLWASSIALVVDGVPRVGVVSSPTLGARCWATVDGGAFRGDCSGQRETRAQRLRVSTPRSAARSRAAVWPPGADRLAPFAGAWAWEPPRIVPHVDVLDGTLDACVFVNGAAWDYAAYAVLIEAAGGRYSDGDGTRRLDTGTAVFSNSGPVHAALLNVIASRAAIVLQARPQQRVSGPVGGRP